jgi:hypothetical protein
MSRRPLIFPGDRHKQVPRAKLLARRWLVAMGDRHLARAINMSVPVHGASSVRGVKKIQDKHGLVVDGIIGPNTWRILERQAFRLPLVRRASWGARAPKTNPVSVSWTRTTPTRVHHTATAAPRARPWLLGSRLISEEKQYVRSIQNYHMDTAKYNDIGYNYLIMPSGRVYEGRGARWQGAHTLGHNDDCGIAFAGNFQVDKLTWRAKRSYHRLRQAVGVSAGPQYPHRDTSNTACPGSNVVKQLGI